MKAGLRTTVQGLLLTLLPLHLLQQSVQLVPLLSLVFVEGSGVADDFDDVFGRLALLQKVVDVEMEGGLRQDPVHLARKDDDLIKAIGAFDSANELHSVHGGHLVIGDDDGNPAYVLFDVVDRLTRVGEGEKERSALLQVGGEKCFDETDVIHIVVDHQDHGLFGRSLSHAGSGSFTTNSTASYYTKALLWYATGKSEARFLFSFPDVPLSSGLALPS